MFVSGSLLVTQISVPPSPTGLFEEKYNVLPSGLIVGWPELYEVEKYWNFLGVVHVFVDSL